MADSATIVTNTCVSAGHESEFAAWQAEMSRLVGSFPGFVSTEIIPPCPPTQVDWVIVQRFETPELLHDWLASSDRAAMVAKIQPVLVGDDAVNVFVGSDAPEPVEETTAVVMTKVAKDAEAAFKAWHKDLDAQQSKFPGYLGCELQPPVDGFQDEWVTLLRFDSAEHLNDWLRSPEREAMVKQARPFVEKSVIRQAHDGFANWFTFGAAREGMAPAWKNNYIVLLGLYPIVMLEIMFLNPFFDWLPIPVGNFIGNIISVGVLGWPVIWLLSKWFAWWLTPKEERTPGRDWAGVILVLAIIAVMGVAFYLLGEVVQIAPVTKL